MSRVLANDVRHVFGAWTATWKVTQSRICIHGKTASCYSVAFHNCRDKLRSGLLASDTTRARQHRAFTTSSRALTVESNGSAGDDAPKSPLAIVFTDIVKSTTIWENDTSAMTKAMTIHDDLIRKLTDTYTGYEVKQNGDGFMIAFQSAVSALNFCLDVQMQLQEQEWPQELLEMGPGMPVVENGSAENKTVLWKGLRLRMSAHFGEPVCKWNGVIKRMDYLGPAVNRAARFVGVCEGGQIVVSQEFLDELKLARREIVGENGPLFTDGQAENSKGLELDLAELQEDEISERVADSRFQVRLLGDRHFKGVSGDQRLFFIVPKSLNGRLEYFPRHKYLEPSKGNLTG